MAAQPLDLNGIFPPIPTPFAGQAVAYDHLAANVRRWSRTGIRGVVVLGSNGEYPLLSEDEKRRTVAVVAEAAPPGMPIIAGTGCESTRATVELTRACAAAGAQAALVVSPHYYAGRMNEAALMRHYQAVADASPVPILLYNVPKFTHMNLAPSLVAALSRHPNIVGIKDSSGNVSQLGDYLNRVDPGFKVLVGTAGVLYGALSLGCCGGVLALANVAPAQCVRVQSLMAAGEHAAAAALQRRLIPVNTAVTATYGIAGLKAALDRLGYYGGDPRGPLLPATAEERTAIAGILRAAGLLQNDGDSIETTNDP